MTSGTAAALPGESTDSTRLPPLVQLCAFRAQLSSRWAGRRTAAPRGAETAPLGRVPADGLGPALSEAPRRGGLMGRR